MQVIILNSIVEDILIVIALIIVIVIIVIIICYCFALWHLTFLFRVLEVEVRIHGFVSRQLLLLCRRDFEYHSLRDSQYF